MSQFASQVSKFARKAEANYRAIARTSVQDTVDLAQRVRKAGGRMRVKTGFLRASIQGGINQVPQGLVRGNPKQNYPSQVSGEPVPLTILRWNPISGDTIIIGWTANYARHREAQDGFLRGASELWSRTVDKAAAKVRASNG